MRENINENQVFEKIKEAIYELCPVKKPRIDLRIKDSSREKKIGIDFNFYRDEDNLIKVQIGFLESNCLTGRFVSKYYLVDEVISKETVDRLISFLLSEFPYAKNFHTYPTGFEMEVGLGVEHLEEEGISCSGISVQFSTHPLLMENLNELFCGYLEYIICNFREQVSKNPRCVKDYKKFGERIKKVTLDSFSVEEMKQLVDLLDEEELRILLCGIDTGSFFKLCDMIRESASDVKTDNKGCALKRVYIG